MRINRDTRRGFNDWCAANYQGMCQRLNIYAPVDEDALHDAFLYLAENIGKIEPQDYEKTLTAQYRRISGQLFSQSCAECRPDELFFTMLSDSEPEEENDEDDSRDPAELVKNIRRYIKYTFSETLATLFDMRTQGYSYRNLAECFGMSEREVRENEKLIINRVRVQFAHAI